LKAVGPPLAHLDVSASNGPRAFFNTDMTKIAIEFNFVTGPICFVLLRMSLIKISIVSLDMFREPQQF
jgi:hypothetical protein